MTTGTIIAAWKDNDNAHIVVSVQGDATYGGKAVAVEYHASAPLVDSQGQAKDGPTLKEELTDAVKAQRQAQAAAPSALALTGPVAL